MKTNPPPITARYANYVFVLLFLLYMFDYNVRQSSILGLVGAGGIGFYIINYIKFFEYGKVAIFMVVVLATVLIIDWVSVKIRDKYIIKSQHGMEVSAK